MARAIWSGSISFGLVNVPVKMYTAVRDRSVHFHMLSDDGKCRLRRKLYCPDTGKEYDFNQTARGYEVAPDQYIIITDDELNALKPEAGRTIEITDFVDLSQIDPLFYNRPYYLAPDERGVRAYFLLHEAMMRAGKVGIAHFVMRQKQYLAALRPMEHILCVEVMNYADEIVSVEELPGTEFAGEVDKRELGVAQRLIDALSGDFDPGKYHDEYREKVLELIERKAAGEEVVLQPSSPEPRRVADLMEALEASLQQVGRGAERRPRKRSQAEPARKQKKPETRKSRSGSTSRSKSNTGRSRTSSRARKK